MDFQWFKEARRPDMRELLSQQVTKIPQDPAARRDVSEEVVKDPERFGGNLPPITTADSRQQLVGEASLPRGS
jgi:hypothetical protein